MLHICIVHRIHLYMFKCIGGVLIKQMTKINSFFLLFAKELIVTITLDSEAWLIICAF